MRLGLLSGAPILTLADLLQGRTVPDPQPPLAAILDAISQLTKATYDHALIAVATSKKKKNGRPPSLDRVRLEAAASMWLDQNGTPEKQAELERALADWCQVAGIDPSERTIRTVAAVAKREHEQQRGPMVSPC